MLTELTRTQKEKFPFYVDKWTRIGLDVADTNKSAAEEAIAKLYRCGGLEPPKQIVYCDSPLSMYLTLEVLKTIKKDGLKPASVRASIKDSIRASVWASVWASVRDSVWASVRASVRASVWDSVWDSVRASVKDSVKDSVRAFVGDSVGASVGASVGDSVWASVRDSVRDSVRASVWDSVWASVGDSVRDSVRASVGDSVWDSVRDSVRDSVFGQHEAAWLSFYSFFIDECQMDDLKTKLEGLFAVAQECHWLHPSKDICFVSHKPISVRVNTAKRLHADGEAAVEYRDEFAVFALNGVRVPEAIALTPAADLPAELITTETNAEIRGEIVKKIGLQRIIRELNAKVLDSRSFSNTTGEHSYELLELNIGDGRRRPFLKMNNPSIDEVHIEGVHPDIRTVTQAIMFRNNLNPKQIDEENGADYYQQGDVLFFPLGAEKFKLFPKFLT